MKRFLSILLSALLIVSSITTVAFAEEAKTTVVFDKVTAKAGASVDVCLTFGNTPELMGFGFKISHDENLTLDNMVLDTEVVKASQTDVNLGKKTVNATYDNGEGKEGYIKCDGKVLTLTFTVSSEANVDDVYDISMKYCTITRPDAVEEAVDIEYELTAGSITVVADPMPEDLAVANKTVTYGEDYEMVVTGNTIDADVNYTYKKGDEVLAGKPTDAGEYTVEASFTKEGFTPTKKTAILTIEPKVLTVDVEAVGRPYDGTNVVDLEYGESALVGIVGADEVSLESKPADTTVDNKNAGTKTVDVDFALTGSKANNYTVAKYTDTVEITKVDLTVTADNKVMCKDTSLPELTYTITTGALATGESNADVFDGLLDTEADGTVIGDNFAITQGTFDLKEAAKANYNLTFVPGVLKVTAKFPVNVTVSMTDWTYGGDAGIFNYAQEDAGNGTVEGAALILFEGTTDAGEVYSSTDKPIDAGNYKVTVTYENETLYGSNFDEFRINKATYVMNDVTISGVVEYGYTHIDEIALTAANLPSDKVTVKKISYKLDDADEVDVPDAAGIYDVIVAFENKDTNYNDPDAKVFENALTILAEAPTAVTIKTSVSSKKITVTVTANANGQAITDYQVSIDNINWKTATIVDGKGTYEFTTLEDGTELENGTEYTIYAKATNGIGEYVNADNTGIKATPKAQQNTSRPISNSNKLPSGDLGSVTDSDKPSTDEPGTDEPSTDEPSTDEPSTEEPAEDIEIVVDPDEEVAVINPAEAVEKDAETGAIVWENTYEDVKADEWYADAVGFAKTTGLMNGVGETSFAPDATLTRGMFATILYRLVEAPEAAQKVGFKDVSDDAWYADAINWGAKNGIVSGVGGGNFAPDDVVTREQMATMLYRFATLMGHEAEAAALGFADAEHVADWAEEAFAWCTANGIINGVSDTELAPQETATRAQAAAVFMRTVEFFNK